MSTPRTARHYTKDEQVEALVAFKAKILDKVVYMAGNCWKSNLQGQFKELNDILKSARKIGVYDGTVFVSRELEEMRSHVAPLKDLGMGEQIKRFLIDELVGKGVPKEHFVSQAA